MFDNYLKIHKEGLSDDVIPFWINNCIDEKYGGFFLGISQDGTVIDTDKGVWQIARFTWLLSTIYNEVEEKKEWIDIAKSGADFLMNYGFDNDGKMFFHLDREGRPIRKRRYAFSEAFSAIAFAAIFKATNEKKYEVKARFCFDNYIKYSEKRGPKPPKFTKTRLGRTIGTPMIGIATAQELRKNLNDESYSFYIANWIKEIDKYFVKHEKKMVMENVDLQGKVINHFDGRLLNPGHAIEAAWFIMDEAIYRGNDQKLVKLGTTMLDYMWEIGWDKEYGGIFYFRDPKNLPVQEYWHDMKFWWPQNETIIATLLAHKLTENLKYLEWFQAVHKYTFDKFPDPEFGEWFGYLHRDGRISVTLKGNLWKGPFHIPRMHLKVWKSLKTMEKI